MQNKSSGKQTTFLLPHLTTFVIYLEEEKMANLSKRSNSSSKKSGSDSNGKASFFPPSQFKNRKVDKVQSFSVVAQFETVECVLENKLVC